MIWTDEQKQAALEEIERRLCNGEWLVNLCREVHLPPRGVLRMWMDADETMAANIAAAQHDGFDVIALETIRIADNQSEHPARSKLRIDSRLKILSKLDPARYGDKVQHADADGEKLPAVSFIIQPVAPRGE